MKINVSNEKLRMFLMNMFKKPCEELTEDDISKVKIVALSCDKEKERLGMECLLSFPNLNEVNITTSIIRNDDIEVLSKLKNLKIVNFNKCVFEDDKYLSLLDKLESLAFNECCIEDYSFLPSLNNLDSLKISKPYTGFIDISLFMSFSRLKTLYLEDCKIINMSLLSNLKDCYLLSILGSEFDNQELSFLLSMKKLEKLFINLKFMDNKVISELKDAITIRNDYSEYMYDEEEFVVNKI